MRTVPVNRRRSTAAFAAGATCLVCAACGSSGDTSAARPDPPVPIVLSALIGGGDVRISPSRIGAGPVLVTVANESRRAAALLVTRSGRSRPLARTAPINPQGVTSLKFDLTRGAYVVSVASPTQGSDAQRSRSPVGATTALRVGRQRPSGGNQVLQP